MKRFEDRRENLKEFVFYEDANDSSILWSYLAQFQTKDRRNKKKFRPKKIPYILGNGTFFPEKN